MVQGVSVGEGALFRDFVISNAFEEAFAAIIPKPNQFAPPSASHKIGCANRNEEIYV